MNTRRIMSLTTPSAFGSRSNVIGFFKIDLFNTQFEQFSLKIGDCSKMTPRDSPDGVETIYDVPCTALGTSGWFSRSKSKMSALDPCARHKAHKGIDRQGYLARCSRTLEWQLI